MLSWPLVVLAFEAGWILGTLANDYADKLRSRRSTEARGKGENVSIKAKLLAVLETRKRNQEHNLRAACDEAQYLARLHFADDRDRTDRIENTRRRESDYRQELADIDRMIALVTNHCPEEP